MDKKNLIEDVWKNVIFLQKPTWAEASA